MKQLRCLIIDDKPLAIDILVEYVSKIPFLELFATTTNPIDGLRILREQQIDLVFLDIQMPGLTGLQFIKIAGKQSKIILTTAYAKYALDGYEHDVIDYLLKPIAFDRFYRAAEKALQALVPCNKVNLSGITQIVPAQELLFVKTEYRIQKIDLKDILFVESIQNYISITTKLERILSLQSLKNMEGQLPEKEFVRVHKSFIIALRHISSIERSRIKISDHSIPIGDSYRRSFYNLIDND